MAKRYTYPLRRIKKNYSYSTSDISELFAIDIATVRIWIKEGLKLIPKTRPHLVHSSDLYDFLNKRQTKRKKPCLPNQIYCCGCKKSHKPIVGSLCEEKLPNGCYRLKAKCEHKGIVMYRVVKASDWHNKHPLASFKQGATKQHNGEQQTPLKYEFQEGEQGCLNLTL